MVQLLDNAALMEKFLALPCPRMFMYGEQNRSLTYLPRLAARGVQLAEIARSGHFPRYSNAPEMWSRIAAFQRQPPTAAGLEIASRDGFLRAGMAEEPNWKVETVQEQTQAPQNDQPYRVGQTC
jgi:hypothetical protein